MPGFFTLLQTSVSQAGSELRANKLRSALSLLGITIGIFCILAVLTMLDSMQQNIRRQVATLGSDVLYVNRWPWMDDGGEYRWWEYWQRRGMGVQELRAVQQVPSASLVTLVVSARAQNLHRGSETAEGSQTYAVMPDFEKVQNIDIAKGRYLSAAELGSGTPAVVLGSKVYESLFPAGEDAPGESVTFNNRRFRVVGVMKKVGQNAAGFDFDNALVYPYYAANTDFSSLEYDPLLLVKAAAGNRVADVQLEMEGALRRARKVAPGEANNFAVNQLSQISGRLDSMFSVINGVGWLIGGFSLVVGLFGIANIMFITVKERTRFIGLKKAIGAHSRDILIEFLTEAVVLCALGGLVGILLVWLLSLLLSRGFDYPIALSQSNFILGIGISTIVGLLAGIVPALRAAKMDPVVAMRAQ